MVKRYFVSLGLCAALCAALVVPLAVDAADGKPAPVAEPPSGVQLVWVQCDGSVSLQNFGTLKQARATVASTVAYANQHPAEFKATGLHSVTLFKDTVQVDEQTSWPC